MGLRESSGSVYSIVESSARACYRGLVESLAKRQLMSFFAKVLNHLFNTVLVETLANRCGLTRPPSRNIGTSDCVRMVVSYFHRRPIRNPPPPPVLPGVLRRYGPAVSQIKPLRMTSACAACSRTFQRFAVRTNEALTEMTKKGARRHHSWKVPMSRCAASMPLFLQARRGSSVCSRKPRSSRRHSERRCDGIRYVQSLSHHLLLNGAILISLDMLQMKKGLEEQQRQRQR